MSYIAKGRYIDSTNRNGTFEVEVPSQDRRHIEQVVASRYIAKKVIVNSVNPSPSMLAQEHRDRVRQLDEERRQRAQAPSGVSQPVARAHAHPAQQPSTPTGIIPLILLGIVTSIVVNVGGQSPKETVPAGITDAPQVRESIPTRPEYFAPVELLEEPPAPPAPIEELPEPPSRLDSYEVYEAPVYEEEVYEEEPSFEDVRNLRSGRDR